MAPSIVNNDWPDFPQAMKWKLLSTQTIAGSVRGYGIGRGVPNVARRGAGGFVPFQFRTVEVSSREISSQEVLSHIHAYEK